MYVMLNLSFLCSVFVFRQILCNVYMLCLYVSCNIYMSVCQGSLEKEARGLNEKCLNTVDLPSFVSYVLLTALRWIVLCCGGSKGLFTENCWTEFTMRRVKLRINELQNIYTYILASPKKRHFLENSGVHRFSFTAPAQSMLLVNIVIVLRLLGRMLSVTTVLSSPPETQAQSWCCGPGRYGNHASGN